MRVSSNPYVLTMPPLCGVIGVCLSYLAIGQSPSVAVALQPVMVDAPRCELRGECGEQARLLLRPDGLVLQSGCGEEVRLARRPGERLVDERLGAVLRIDQGRMRWSRYLTIEVADGVHHGEVVAAIDAAYGAGRYLVAIAGTFPQPFEAEEQLR
jgi:hypothetical protein